MEQQRQDGHAFAFTLSGRCFRCHLMEAEHPKMLTEPDPMTGCWVDHATLNTALVIDEHGLEWRRCSDCGRMVEGALRTGEVIGPAYGKGRGDLTMRQRQRLAAWAGWERHLDGRTLEAS